MKNHQRWEVTDAPHKVSQWYTTKCPGLSKINAQQLVWQTNYLCGFKILIQGGFLTIVFLRHLHMGFNNTGSQAYPGGGGKSTGFVVIYIRTVHDHSTIRISITSSCPPWSPYSQRAKVTGLWTKLKLVLVFKLTGHLRVFFCKLQVKIVFFFL